MVNDINPYIKLLISIKLLLSEINTECEKLEKLYDPTIQHFNIGDLVYYVNPHGIIIPSVIDEIQNFQDTTGPGGFIYYWIIPEGCKISIFNKIKFWLSTNLPWLRITYNVPKWCPGHALLAGDDIFKTEDEAVKSLLLSNLKYNLTDYKNLLTTGSIYG
jgi:hypothetical protein